MKLENLEIYTLSMSFADKVWNIVILWDFFAKDTIGKQFVRAADSISANISEGFGRDSFKDSRKFYYIARGSLYETKTWLDKSFNRNLILEPIYKSLFDELNVLGLRMNNFIKAHNQLIKQNNQ